MLYRSIKAVAMWLERAAAGALAAMMLLTVADVLLRAIDPNWRIPGVVEIVVLVFAFSVFLAIAATFVLEQNIVVSLVDSALSRPLARALAVGTGTGTLVYLGMLIAQGFVNAQEAVKYDDQTMQLALPIALFWVAILIGFTVAFAAELLLLVKAGPSEDGPGKDGTGSDSS